MRKIKHGSRTYLQLLMELAHYYMRVRDCKNCGAPMNDGYVCWHCHVDDTTYEFQEKLKKKEG